MIHENSLEAYAKLKPTRRRAIIFKVLNEAKYPMTDREILNRLYDADLVNNCTDMNLVRPRITEMIDDGVLIPCDSVVCSVISRTVRTTRVRLLR